MYYQALLIAILLAFVSGCGSSETAARTEPQGGNPGAACPLAFANAGLCASAQWTTGPTADAKSALRLKFWSRSQSSANGPWSEPAAEVGAYVRMTCCGSISYPRVTREADGEYLISDIVLTPGEWEVYIQLKNGAETEKQFISLKLDV